VAPSLAAPTKRKFSTRRRILPVGTTRLSWACAEMP